ncbi:hypothetical protein [Sphingobium yanoikuyae]|uniref:hypothetical protein n=1 Tax=Sphingobium yanoikuyae TaxID=13690 RepID=UPI0028AF758E|nr:hypothetical protein [Sphingobium yanoikuyae]
MIGNTKDAAKPTARQILTQGLSKIRFGDSKGVDMVRSAPFAASTLEERVAISVIAAQSDPDVLEWSKQAQVDERMGHLAQAEFNYWRCTDKYPFHKIFSFNYGHVLFKDNKLLDAECQLRNAWALGAASTECRDLIQTSMSRQGLPAAPVDKTLFKSLTVAPSAIDSDAKAYPTLHTIRAFSHVLLDNPDPSIEVRTQAQRAAWDANSLLTFFIQLPEFRYKNLNLLLVLKSRISEGLI